VKGKLPIHFDYESFCFQENWFKSGAKIPVDKWLPFSPDLKPLDPYIYRYKQLKKKVESIETTIGKYLGPRKLFYNCNWSH